MIWGYLILGNPHIYNRESDDETWFWWHAMFSKTFPELTSYQLNAANGAFLVCKLE
jgi:hypothetical protein